MMSGEDEDGKYYDIEEMLQDYGKDAIDLTKDGDLKTFINEQLMAGETGSEEGWSPHLTYAPLIRSAAGLSMIQSTVRQIEFSLLQELVSE